MSKEILSQEEIDALLQGLSEEEEPTGNLTDTMLNTALETAKEDGLEIQLQGWEASYPSVEDLMASSGELWGSIVFGGDIETLGFYRAPMAVVHGHQNGEEAPSLLQSVMEYVARSAAAAIADARGYFIDVQIDEPTANTPGLEELAGNEWYQLNVSIETPGDASMDVGILLPDSIRDLIHGTYEEPADAPPESEVAVNATEDAKAVPPPSPRPATESKREVPKDVSPARFPAFGDRRGPGGQTGGNGRIDMLLDVPLQVSVELGRTVEDIRQILSLGTGSVIELDRQAGEPVDVLVNGKLLARGEVVVVDESFAVRITEIVSLEDRIRNLR